MSDRSIHVELPDGSQVVRYERAGKWYREWQGGRQHAPLRLAEAVQLASEAGAVVYLDVPGGGAFDARVRRATGATR